MKKENRNLIVNGLFDCHPLVNHQGHSINFFPKNKSDQRVPVLISRTKFLWGLYELELNAYNIMLTAKVALVIFCALCKIQPTKSK